ncbi:hypothetical protein BHU72_06975 [Desulfuribacillus stibiiarsenatis]|uniref:Flagellar protein n=1 Tax=Desulfuribacillus stibiiarsenatis TaxID=1390249 RepID=A0A1E5L466_9FIRM|nr:hypothetical protein [Desulfuribacillus stibiiarsenatis]OEH84928.1 hypothetical protein BHU72_06975 [Desulfuribacillus stibiiarsenatis]
MEKYCEMCKNPFFAAANERICGACKEKDKEEKYLEDVIAYIKDYPNHSVAQVIQDTKVPYDMLQKFIREKKVDLIIDPQYAEQVKREKQRLFNELANAKKSLQSPSDKAQNSSSLKKDNLTYQVLKDRL